jgi:hypothetical protein
VFFSVSHEAIIQVLIQPALGCDSGFGSKAFIAFPGCGVGFVSSFLVSGEAGCVFSGLAASVDGAALESDCKDGACGRRERESEEIIDAVTFARQMLGFHSDQKQELVLRGGRRGIVNCTRQWGGQGRASGVFGAGSLTWALGD